MFSPISTMFQYFPLRAWSTVLTLGAISWYTYRRARIGWETGTMTKEQSIARWLLVSYILLLLFMTVLGRRSLDYYRYNFDIGYSFRAAFREGNAKMAKLIAVNIAIFLPVGFLGTIGWKRFGFLKALLIGIALTATIEGSQLLLRNGTCEIDDLISNAIGTLCGCIPGGICSLALKWKKSSRKKEKDVMKQVYLTALTNERYIPGVMALARSLREVEAQYPLAVMIPEEKEAELTKALRDYGVLKLPNVFVLPKPNVPTWKTNEQEKVVEEKYSYWRDTFFKLQAAGCTEYKKVILLDSDMMVVKNIDHLFKKPSFTATICGKCVHDEWKSLNSGLMVLETSSELHQKLLSLINPAIEFKASKGLQAGDQDVFHLAVPEWRNCPELFIPEYYSICWGWISNLCKKEKCVPKDFYVIHFTGKQKPWHCRKNYILRIAISMILRGKTEKYFYKNYAWIKYRSLCDRF